MGQIGVLGPIVFETRGPVFVANNTDPLVRTFKDLRRRGESRWAKHEVYGGVPFLEFIGPGTSEFSFEVYLNSQLGINPQAELDQMRKLMNAGTPLQFTIGNNNGGVNGQRFIGDFVIRSLEEEMRHFDRAGQITNASAHLTLEEYRASTNQTFKNISPV